jgi:hypothetical protein
VDSLECEARNEEIYGNCAVITATELRRAADLLSRLAPQPVPEGPTDDELLELRRSSSWLSSPEEFLNISRAVLARWGQA